MTRHELYGYLRQHGVNPQLFHIEGVHDSWGSETWYLRRSGDAWEVGYSERNRKDPFSYHENEADACDALLRLLRASDLQEIPREDG